MSKGCKVSLVVGIVLAGLCCIACAVMSFIVRYTMSMTVATEPGQATTLGRTIVDYSLPGGYAEVFGFDVFKLKWVIIASEDEDALTMMLMQIPHRSDMTPEEMQSVMTDMFAQQSDYGNVSSLQVVETRQVIVNDQPATLTISESQSDLGKTMRQAVVVFPGKAGVVMLMAMGDAETWDQEVLDEFLASIH
ncbi:MAG: hypothetical protein JW850_00260 [Thermoflexales bacterium]|nr:hypothetical protein [Thermoflexales bacterium]